MRAPCRFFPEQSELLDPDHLSTDALSGSQRQGPAGLSGSLTAAGDLSCLPGVLTPCSVLCPYLWVSKHCEPWLWQTERWTLDWCMWANFSHGLQAQHSVESWDLHVADVAAFERSQPLPLLTDWWLLLYTTFHIVFCNLFFVRGPVRHNSHLLLSRGAHCSSDPGGRPLTWTTCSDTSLLAPGASPSTLSDWTFYFFTFFWSQNLLAPRAFIFPHL